MIPPVRLPDCPGESDRLVGQINFNLVAGSFSIAFKYLFQKSFAHGHRQQKIVERIAL